MDSQNLSFVYRNKHGEEKQHELRNWEEVGHYIEGWCVISNGFRTFRKDRVAAYLNGAEAWFEDPHPSPASISVGERKKQHAPQIVFTGFPSVQRAVLEMKATDAGMDVRKTVTLGLDFLCGGPTAGPAKLKKARQQQVYIMSQAQFFALLETGELPDEEPEFF